MEYTRAGVVEANRGGALAFERAEREPCWEAQTARERAPFRRSGVTQIGGDTVCVCDASVSTLESQYRLCADAPEA